MTVQQCLEPSTPRPLRGQNCKVSYRIACTFAPINQQHDTSYRWLSRTKMQLLTTPVLPAESLWFWEMDIRFFPRFYISGFTRSLYNSNARRTPTRLHAHLPKTDWAYINTRSHCENQNHHPQYQGFFLSRSDNQATL